MAQTQTDTQMHAHTDAHIYGRAQLLKEVPH